MVKEYKSVVKISNLTILSIAIFGCIKMRIVLVYLKLFIVLNTCIIRIGLNIIRHSSFGCFVYFMVGKTNFFFP